jgi:hypothetical protein
MLSFLLSDAVIFYGFSALCSCVVEMVRVAKQEEMHRKNWDKILAQSEPNTSVCQACL